MKIKKMKSSVIDFTFVLPALAVFTFIVLIPLVRGITISFTSWDGVSLEREFVGLKNYVTILHDGGLLLPIKNTILFTVVTTVAINVLGLVLAMAVNKKFAGVNAIKSIIFMPLILSLVLVSVIWVYIYNDLFSIFNLKSPLINKNTAMLGICLISIWREVGLAMMIYFAGIKSIPTDMYEAACIDGANAWQRFKSVTVPFLAPAFTYCIPLWIGLGLRQYDYSMVATKGGPGHASESIAYYIYNYEFPYYKTGYGQSIAVVFLICVTIISYVVTSALRKREIEL